MGFSLPQHLYLDDDKDPAICIMGIEGGGIIGHQHPECDWNRIN